MELIYTLIAIERVLRHAKAMVTAFPPAVFVLDSGFILFVVLLCDKENVWEREFEIFFLMSTCSALHIDVVL